MSPFIVLLCTVVLFSTVGAFRPSIQGRFARKPTTIRMSTSATPQIFRKLASALLVGAFTTISLPYPSFSAVGEGDLPPGVMAFGKVVKYQV